MSGTVIVGGKAPRGGIYSAKSVRPFRIETDPPVRSDGLCAIGDCRRKLPKLSLLHGDPFCSTGCCRTFYGAELPASAGAGRPRTVSP